MKLAAAGLVLGCILCPALVQADQPPIQLTHLWVYISPNLNLDEEIRQTSDVLTRAARAGYTGVVLAGNSFMRWESFSEKQLLNLRYLVAHCRRLKLDLVVAVMPIGSSGGLLSHDPNLAAGLPVREAPFTVAKGLLVPADDSASLANGSFEQFDENTPSGWQLVDQPGKISFIDPNVFHQGRVSLRMQDIRKHSRYFGHARIMQRLKVIPFRYYHASAMVKTDKLIAKQLAIQAYAGGKKLNHTYPRLEPTQDWTRVHFTFNSLDHEQVSLYMGVWGGRAGTIWWDDVRIEPGGLVNIVRRDGAPLKVTSEDRKNAYVESRDFGSIHDRLLGNSRYRGDYSVWHAAPAARILPGSRISEGARLLLSYYHTVKFGRSQVMCCMSEPKVYEILEWHISKVRDNIRPDGYFMMHDEIRVQGWDESCTRRNMTAGQILADNAKRCTNIIRRSDPGKPIYVWSDMFDPYHNAEKTGRYYLAKGEGPWNGSWEGLDKDVIVVNWHGKQPNRRKSMEHFATRGHKQILGGYYDHGPRRIAWWLREAAAASVAQSVIGVMYTSWKKDYDDLEAFAETVTSFQQGSGR